MLFGKIFNCPFCKVALDISSPQAGRVVGVFVEVGDRVPEGALLLTIETE